MGDDLGQIFVYANSVTNGWAVLFILIAFYLIILIGGMFSQLQISGRIRPEVHFMTASFITLGLAVIMSTVNGLLAPIYLLALVGINILCLIWLMLTSPY